MRCGSRRRLPGRGSRQVNNLGLPLALEPGLVEEAVLLAVRATEQEPKLRRERDKLYRLAVSERERSFGELHAHWFKSLGLDRPIRSALEELPALSTRCDRCLVARARTGREEGADLLVATDAGGGSERRTILIRLLASHVAQPDGLIDLLRAELLHVADMVDPDFGYEPELPPLQGGPSYEQLLRDLLRDGD